MPENDEKQVWIPGHGPVDTVISLGNLRELLKEFPDSWSLFFLALPEAHLVLLDEDGGRRGIIDLKTGEKTLWGKAI